MFDPTKFTVQKAKPLPVVLLLDVSTSMSADKKISALNEAVETMIASFANAEEMKTEIQVAVITFGSEVALHMPYTSASKIEWTPLRTSGWTPLGSALELAKNLIEDKEKTPSRAYRPTVVLVSDGQPTDEWKRPFHNFLSTGRSQKCDRMAMAIGGDADEAVLTQFIAGTEHELLRAHNAAELRNAFRYVTMSVTTRSRSTNPNQVPSQKMLLLEMKSKNSSLEATNEPNDEPNW